MSGTQAVDRTAGLLLHVLGARGPVTFGELTQSSGLAKSTTSRLLTALELHGLLRRDRAGAFLPGAAIDRYARSQEHAMALVQLVRPSLSRVVAATGETANLAVASGGNVDLIDQVDGTYMLGTINWVGRTIASHASALGKVLLAEGLLPKPRSLPRLTEHTITDAEVLDRELARVRRDGYAVIRDELEIGLAAVAVPVFDAGAPAGAVSLSGPTGRFDDQRVRTMAVLLREEFKAPRRSREGAA